jgi:hypothetical protein
MAIKVRKEIHLSPPIIISLEKIAATTGTSLKKYIEDLVIRKTKSRIARIKKHLTKTKKGRSTLNGLRPRSSTYS